MSKTFRPLITYAATAALVSALVVAAPQMARADNQIGGIGSSRTLTAKVKVKSVNLATRCHAVFTDADEQQLCAYDWTLVSATTWTRSRLATRSW